MICYMAFGEVFHVGQVVPSRQDGSILPARGASHIINVLMINKRMVMAVLFTSEPLHVMVHVCSCTKMH